MCSHVDSFTPEKGAIHIASPSQSYKKCNIVPTKEVTAKPISCQSPIDRFIHSPPQIDNIVYGETTENMLGILLAAEQI